MRVDASFFIELIIIPLIDDMYKNWTVYKIYEFISKNIIIHKSFRGESPDIVHNCVKYIFRCSPIEIQDSHNKLMYPKSWR